MRFAVIIDDKKTRSDNDMYGHLNNSIYAFLFDTIINAYLVLHCGMHPSYSPFTPASSPLSGSAAPGKSSLSCDQVGIVVSSYCDYFASVSFPDMLDLGLRVTKLGFSSVTYEVGVFNRGEENVKVVGGFTHVFVMKDGTRLSTATTTNNNSAKGKKDGELGMEEGLRAGLELLMMVPDSKRGSKL